MYTYVTVRPHLVLQLRTTVKLLASVTMVIVLPLDTVYYLHMFNYSNSGTSLKRCHWDQGNRSYQRGVLFSVAIYTCRMGSEFVVK